MIDTTRKPAWIRIRHQSDESAVIEYHPKLEPVFMLVNPHRRLWWDEHRPRPRPLIVTRICADYGKSSGLVLSIEGSPPKGEAFVQLSESASFRLCGYRSRALPWESRTRRTLKAWADELHRILWGSQDAQLNTGRQKVSSTGAGE